jgi:DNA-binding NarL/FixJ family response regulator
VITEIPIITLICIMQSPIQIAIFDDSKHLREALSILIRGQKDMRLVGNFADASNLLNDIRETSPEVILMDIDMPVINGIEAVTQIKKEFPGIAVMMLTVFEDEDKVFRSLCAGAIGYMLKNTEPIQLLDAIRELHQGGAPMTPSIARKVLLHFQQTVVPVSTESFDLSEREKDVLRHLVQGKSYKMIGDSLGIGYETVRSHMKHIYEKLHVASMTEAVAKTLRLKILD